MFRTRGLWRNAEFHALRKEIMLENIFSNLIGFYGISTLVGYLMPIHVYTCIHIKYKWLVKHIVGR